MALVSYVKKLNIPSGVVGACRLDLAYEHFKVVLTFSIKCSCVDLSMPSEGSM